MPQASTLPPGSTPGTDGAVDQIQASLQVVARSITQVRMHERLPNDKARRARIEELIRGQYDRLARYESVEGGWGYLDFGAGTQRPNSFSCSFVNATVLVEPADPDACLAPGLVPVEERDAIRDRLGEMP